MKPDLGDMAMRMVYFVIETVIGVMHSRISISSGKAYN
jgi:hypothetical protein